MSITISHNSLMESPFASTNNTFVLYLEPILNSFFQTYQNVITVSSMPSGPIADLVAPMPFDDLSPFQSGSKPNCTMVLLRYPKGGSVFSRKCRDYFMTAHDIPSVISYLRQNGYTIDTQLTNMIQKSAIAFDENNDHYLSGNKKMICVCSYP